MGLLVPGVVSSAKVAAAAFLFEDTWQTANDTHWDYLKWVGQRGGTFNVTSNKGVFVGSGGPGQAYTDQVVTDAEILVKVQWTAGLTGSDFPEIGWRISSGTASGTGGSGYLIQLNGGNGRVDIYKVGAYSSIGNATDAALRTAGTYWFRINVVGTTHKVRWWADGGSEPGTWQITATDATFTFGACCVRSYSSLSMTFHSFQITDLASPVTPADGSLRDTTNAQASISASFSTSDLTMCAWFMVPTLIGSSQPIIGVSNGGSNYFLIGLNSAGVIGVAMNPSDFNIGITPTVNVWYFVAVTRTNGGGIEVYYAPSGSGLTKFTSANNGTPNGTFHLLGDTFGLHLSGSLAAPKIWTAVLSQAELTTEMGKYAAQRTANLWASYEYTNGYDYVDHSGNGRVLTFIGGVASGPAGAPCT